MLDEVSTGRPDEFIGEIAIDWTSTYFDKFCEGKIDRAKYTPVGVSFSIFQGELHLDIYAIPKGFDMIDGKRPVVKINTNTSLEEFAQSPVLLRADAFQYKNDRSAFFEVDEDDNDQ